MTVSRIAVSERVEQDLDLVVESRRGLADGVAELVLCRPDGAALPSWEPGAHVDLVLADGLTRQYSLCGDPDDDRTWRVAVLREESGRGGSARIHDELHPGSAIRCRGPRNNFTFDVTRPSYVFIAGGIGITPLIPMLERAEAARASWSLDYGGRSRTSMAFLDELPGGENVRISPMDEVGLIDLESVLGSAADGTAVYVCGPTGLLDAVESIAQRHSLDVAVERFAPRAIVHPEPDTAIEVELAATGVTLTVPAGRSILDVAEDAGAPVASSCGEGTCGTCETVVLAGRPDHRDSLDIQGDGAMLICVSRALSDRLVLDL